ncbi:MULTISPECIES: glycosyltransferase family A protein [unclassified Streptomyces]|uniref:glycosyltransferase family A protein n=1 Tax=unclassified Streptomyces TaxID=2593676 RepID=UPI0027E3ABBC|nr:MULTISPECIES: glycosyltransferase family A protein [unclassified Streptomyces]
MDKKETADRNTPGRRPMVVAVCAFRLENVRRHLRHNLDQLNGDEYVVLLDRPVTPEAEKVATQVNEAGGTMRILGATRGLSASRNTVLREWADRHVLFVDDDVRLDASAVDAVRAAFRAGAHVVGARLRPPRELRRLPWFLSSGQFHLVGWHRDRGDIKIWGACMGVDADFARRQGLTFDLDLSRTGGNLQSGEDTSFIALMKEAGARECLLPEHAVVHDVDPGRLTLRYLLRRAYWQGRSEARRHQSVAGLRKELTRHRTAPESRCTPLLFCVYGAATAIGVGHGLLLRLRK